MQYKQLADQLIKNIYVPSKPNHKSIVGELSGASVVFFYIFHKQKALPKEIAQAFDVSTARVAAVLNALSSKNLITREIDAQDRRQIIVTLTDYGKAIAREQQQQLIDKTAYFLEKLGENDAKEYVRITNRLSEIGKECD